LKYIKLTDKLAQFSFNILSAVHRDSLQIPGVTTMTLVLRHRECDTDKIASLLLGAGYRIQSDDVIFPPSCRDRVHRFYRIGGQSPTEPGTPPMSTVFRHHQQMVPTLTHLCRLCLRRTVAVSCHGRHFVDSIHKLPLPTLLRDFVAFSGEFPLDTR